VTLAAGDDKTCTITNDDNAPALYLVKHVINDDNGTATASDWTLSAGDNDVTGSESGALATDQAGTYALSETSVPDYTNTSITCDDNPGVEVTSVTLGLGETITCTFVNDDVEDVAQITPTATDCTQFASGTAPTLDTLQYSLKGNPKVINQVNPGVFFYWVKVTGSGDNSLTITQTPGTPTFELASGSFVWDSNCVKVDGTTSVVDNLDGSVTVTFSGTGTFYIGLKYNASSLAGKLDPGGTIHFTFETVGVPGSSQGLDLVKK
jgi:hypothetical protein